MRELASILQDVSLLAYEAESWMCWWRIERERGATLDIPLVTRRESTSLKANQVQLYIKVEVTPHNGLKKSQFERATWQFPAGNQLWRWRGFDASPFQQQPSFQQQCRNWKSSSSISLRLLNWSLLRCCKELPRRSESSELYAQKHFCDVDEKHKLIGSETAKRKSVLCHSMSMLNHTHSDIIFHVI